VNRASVRQTYVRMELTTEDYMDSVLCLAEQVTALGILFERDPWTGRTTLPSWHGVPDHIREGLQARWGDLEALLAEQSPPPCAVSDAAQSLLKVPDKPPKRKRRRETHC
jgi:hypothetical protein